LLHLQLLTAAGSAIVRDNRTRGRWVYTLALRPGLGTIRCVQVERLASITFEAAREHSRSWLLGVDDAREALEAARGKFSRVVYEKAIER
jgi:hypothetical protein